MQLNVLELRFRQVTLFIFGFYDGQSKPARTKVPKKASNSNGFNLKRLIFNRLKYLSMDLLLSGSEWTDLVL